MRWLRRTRSGQRSRVMPFRLALVVAQNRQTSGRTPRNLGTTRRIHPLSAPLIPPAPPGHPSFMRHDPEAWRRHAFRYYRRIPPSLSQWQPPPSTRRPCLVVDTRVNSSPLGQNQKLLWLATTLLYLMFSLLPGSLLVHDTFPCDSTRLGRRTLLPNSSSCLLSWTQIIYFF